MPDAVSPSNNDLGGRARPRIGKYQILGRVGRGGMGSVHRAYDPVLERLVALKVISASADLTDELRARFFLEAQACARLTHPNIVTIYDLGEADGQLFIVMELLDGEELRQLVTRRGALPLRDKLSLMMQLCEGLEYAHGRGILHRDIKPGNIFVQREGRVKILDFGVARIEAADTPATRTGLLVGTLQYMAPERVRGHGDLRSDIFSVGAVLYEVLTYRAAFGGADPMEILEKLRATDPVPPSQIDALVPPELDDVVRRALDKDPAGRFDSLGEMHAELRAIHRRLAAAPDAPLPDPVTETAERVRGLREALLARIGTLDRVTGPRPGTGPDVGADIARLQSLIARAERLQPILDDGLAALARNDYETAITVLALVVREMPEHARAAHSLAEARRRGHVSTAAGPRAEGERRASAAQGAATEPASSGNSPATSGRLPSGGTSPLRDDDVTVFAELPVAAPRGRAAVDGHRGPSPMDAIRARLVRQVSAGASTVAGWSSAVRRLWTERPSRQRRVLAGIGVVLAVAIVGLVMWPRTTQRPADRSAELRKLVAAARDNAIRAEAPALAPATFSTAEATSTEAESLVRSGRHADSASSFRTATDRYEAAAREAGRTRDYRTVADQDRQRMLVVKQRAPENGTEFPAALEHERQGDALYTKLQFENAARSFSMAAELYSKVVAPAAPTPAPASEVTPPRPDPAPREAGRPAPAVATDPRSQIRGRLAEYVRAIETKNLTLLRQVRPELGEAELRRWARAFEITRSRKVALTVHDITVDGGQARVTGRRAEVVVFNDGQQRESETRFVCALALRRDGWVILQLRDTEDTGPDGSR